MIHAYQKHFNVDIALVHASANPFMLGHSFSLGIVR